MSIKLKGSSDGSVSFDAPADTSPSGSDITLTLPTSAGSADQFLKNSGIAGELEYSSMVETSTGVGIGGVTSPFDKLQVRTVTDANFVFSSAGGTEASFEIFNNAGSANTPLNYRASEHKFKIQANEKMRLDSSGNLGIGTTSPGLKLHVQDGALASAPTPNSNCDVVIEGTTNTGIQFLSSGQTQLRFGDAASTGAGSIIYNHSSNDLRFSTNVSERVRINDVGRVLFGRAISHDPWGATGNVDAGQYFGSGNNFAAAFNSRNIPCILNRTNSTGTIQEFKYNGQVTGWINTTSTAISINYSSDYRLKENVIPLADSITRVKQLQPKRFNYIVDPDVTVDGFLAHEAQTVVPEAVVGTHNQVDDNGDPVYQGIDPSKMIPLLTAALQEAIAKIETLETKVAALEAA